jgi:hypothetical protein
MAGSEGKRDQEEDALDIIRVFPQLGFDRIGKFV